MKNIAKLFIGLMLVGVVFSSCNEAKDVLDVKFVAEYETELDIIVTPETKSTNGVFNISETIDPTSNSDFAQYASTITGIDISEAKGTVQFINPDVTLISANLTVSNASRFATWTFTNIQISEGTVLTLGNESGQRDTVEDILMDQDVFTVSMTGETVVDSAEFNILVSINSEIVANPIN